MAKRKSSRSAADGPEPTPNSPPHSLPLGKSWQARIGAARDTLAEQFVESLSFDQRLARHDVAGSIAHATMLAKMKLISQAELEQIKGGLNKILADIEAETFHFDIRQEDIHMAIEAALIAQIGEAGKKLHTGRSRNDQVALDVRLWCLEAIDLLTGKIADLQRSLVWLARQYGSFPMPAYTHLQRAQPITIGHELLAYVEMLQRDQDRLADCRRRTAVSPLGGGAVAGSTLPLDRRYAAALLNLPTVTDNSLDSVSDRDFAAELVFCLSLIGVHLSRWAEQWILYSSTEFNFIRIADAYTTGSSMMPQKRNPDLLELTRGKAAGILGNLVALLSMLKGQPLAYNRDMQEDKRWLFSAYDTAEASVTMAAKIVAHTQFNTQVISQRLDEGFLDATVMAEYLVKKGVPFRTAHHLVGTLVSLCETKNLQALSELPLDLMQQHSPVIAADVFEVLGAAKAIHSYQSHGAGGVRQLQLQLAKWDRQLKN
jgi:argininosuccinate lyase